mmetsp:Transcript_5582/g.14769  ORF Transcript_5582/g.14769 Transcript_5582/m.14769 type:complete len:221 (+) Transcript_5582:94-756(+)
MPTAGRKVTPRRLSRHHSSHHRLSSRSARSAGARRTPFAFGTDGAGPCRTRAAASPPSSLGSEARGQRRSAAPSADTKASAPSSREQCTTAVAHERACRVPRRRRHDGGWRLQLALAGLGWRAAGCAGVARVQAAARERLGLSCIRPGWRAAGYRLRGASGGAARANVRRRVSILDRSLDFELRRGEARGEGLDRRGFPSGPRFAERAREVIDPRVSFLL